jgi:hypothetical protein
MHAWRPSLDGEVVEVFSLNFIAFFAKERLYYHQETVKPEITSDKHHSNKK